MWLGIIMGLLLGGAFQSFEGAMVLAIIGGIVGAIVAHNKKGRGDGADPSTAELRRQVLNLQEQMRQATVRIAHIEKYLQETTARSPETVVGEMPAAAEMPLVLAEAMPEVAEEALPPLNFDEDELLRQALATANESVLPELSILELPALAPESLAEVASPLSAVRIEEETPPAKASAAAKVSGESFSRGRRAPAQAAEPSPFNAFVARWIVGGNPIVKVGVLILFLGLAFLLRYVAENTVVPIELRYAGVAAVGVGLLLFGWRWRNKADNYGVILQGAGIGVLYLTTLAGMKLHPLIPAELGFAILIGVAAFAALLAILQDALALAVVAALGGFAAPVLASTGSEHHLAFFSYLTVINLGIVAIAWFKAWRVLNLIGFTCTVFLASAWGDKYYQPELFGLVQPFLLLFFVLYVLISFLFARRTLADAEADEAGSFADHVRQVAPQVSYVDGSLVFGVPLTTFGLQYLIVRSFDNGPAFSALAFGLAYIVLAFALFRRSGMRYALLSETMIALAVIFGSLAIPLGLEGEWTTAAWAVEAAGVYWLGIRQQRVHARLFALLLLFGSAFYFALDVHLADGESVLDGSRFGCLMLALSLGWTYRLLRQAPAGVLHDFEAGGRPWLIACGSFFVALMPFLLWSMDWAATALAMLAALAVFAGRRLGERTLINWGCFYQLLGGGLFMSTLQHAGAGAALASGGVGLLSAGLIGLSMLVGAWGSLGQLGTERRDAAPPASVLSRPVLLAGLLFINLAPLFVLPWRLAAMVWPLTAIVTLGWAIRSGQRSALGFAIALQLVAGLVSLSSQEFWLDGPAPVDELSPFLHSGFWRPLLIALAAFVGARLLQRRNNEASNLSLGWVSLCWATAWWMFAWQGEIARLWVPETAVVGLLALAVLTAGLWQAIARRYDWPQLGQATLAYLPVLAILLAAQTVLPEQHPLAGWGVLVWPLALLLHGRLLRVQGEWLKPAVHQAAHALGACFFVLVAALELHWHFAAWGEADSTWPWLGCLLAPLGYLWSLSSKKLGQRWPFSEFHEAYALVAALPLVLFLLGWTWLGTLLDGSAAPLPYLPLLNPLEIGQFAVLLGLALWWSSLRQLPLFRGSASGFALVLGVSSFVVLSGLVLRACHQWGGVAWRFDALFDSLLAQSSLSIVWSIVAIGLMLFAHRSARRWVWLVGATLVALVVAKLFLVELAAHGSLERIVSFIAVGLLLLLVGYFAPLPPRRDVDAADATHDETSRA